MHVQSCRVKNYCFFPRDASQSKIIFNCHGSKKETTCQIYRWATHTLVTPTSPFSHAAPCELSFTSPIFHSSLFSWSDYSLPFQLMLQPRQKGGQIELDMWTDCKLVGFMEKWQRCGPQLWRSTSRAPPSAKRSSSPRLRQKRQRGREPLSKQEERQRERDGWKGLICTHQQSFLFIDDLFLSTAKEILDILTFYILIKSLSPYSKMLKLNWWICLDVRFRKLCRIPSLDLWYS